MKKRIASLLCAFVLILSLPAVACATESAPRASDYFGATDVRAYAEPGSKILIEIDVSATHTMQQVGASEVYIYEQQSDGGYDCVYTYTKEEYPSLIWTNSACAFVDVTYQGTAGTKYYALVGCYAKDSNGAETLFHTTYVVTAAFWP